MEFYKEKEKELKEMFERLSELNGTIQAHRIYTENNFALEEPCRKSYCWYGSMYWIWVLARCLWLSCGVDF